MAQYTQELRLLWFLGLNALVLASAARVAIAFSGNRRSWVLLDLLLLNYVIEYGLVCALGVVGWLTPLNLTLAAIAVAAALVVVSHFGMTRLSIVPQDVAPPKGRSTALFILFFAAAYELAYLIYRRDLPVLETDALAYHLPVAFDWLRTGRLGILQTWYWNPTNTYSPMGAEALIAWLIAPVGSDLFARAVQAPALIMLLLAMYRIAIALGASPVIAACAASGTVLSRSLFSQATIVKDDLLVAAFFLTAVAALADVAEAERAGDRLVPVRVGCAVGLLLAIKYPTLIALPLLLLVIGPALWTWTRTQLVLAVMIPIALAGPWFLRNAIMFGNPLYPIMINFAGRNIARGIFNTAPDPAMRTAAGIWRMVAGGYFGTPAPFVLAVAILWIIGCAGVRTANPLRYFCGLGAALGVIFFAVASPYPEVRYFLPFLLPFYAGAARGLIALRRWPLLQCVIAVGFVTAAACTTFEISSIDFVIRFSLEAAAMAAAGVGLVCLWQTRRGIALALLAIASFISGTIIYVQYRSFEIRVIENADNIWAIPGPGTYGDLGSAWAFARHRLPPTATIAYANTNLIAPLFGPANARQLVYAPTRPGVHTLADLPSLGEHVPQDKIFQVTTAAMNDHADLITWLENLKNAHADFLFLVKHGSAPSPPEAGFVAGMKWRPLFENDAVAIYQIDDSLLR